MNDVIVLGNQHFNKAILTRMLPDVETALFFAQLYKLDAEQVGILMRALFNSPLVEALTNQGGLHSDLLQDYLVEIAPEMVRQGDIIFGEKPPQGEILPQLWEQAQITIVSTIQEVAEGIGKYLDQLDGRKSEMLFQTLNTLNKQRGTIGTFSAKVQRKTTNESTLVIFDVSGSMSEETVHTIVSDVVALAWKADAHLAIVSNTAVTWPPGGATVEAVLDEAEYGGTHYEALAPLFDYDWGVVLCVADYDSSRSAKSVLAQCPGKVGAVLDVSLVSKQTYLSECIGQLCEQPVQQLIMAEQGTSLCY